MKIREASLKTHTEPLHEDTYALPLGAVDVPGEYAVTVSFRLKEGTIGRLPDMKWHSGSMYTK